MVTINLRSFYPWYTEDEYIEISEEVAEALRSDTRYAASHQRQLIRNKAQYSLDRGLRASQVLCNTLHSAGLFRACGAV